MTTSLLVRVIAAALTLMCVRPAAAVCTAMNFRSTTEAVMNGLRLEFDLMVERPGRG